MISVAQASLLPENLKLIREMIVNSMNPLGLSPKSCASWCKRPCIDEKKGTILYSGGLYSTMGIVERIEVFLKPLISNPTRSSQIKMLKPFMKVSPFFLSLFKNKDFERVPKRAMKLLEHFGYDVCCLDEEPYSGALLYDLGFWKDLKEYGAKLTAFFKERNVKKIIVLDPHTYELFSTVYPDMVGDFDFEVINFIKILADELKKKDYRLKVKNSLSVTYHDPCHYSKGSGEKIIDEPRAIISSINNVTLKETQNRKELSLCCGGPVEFVFLGLSEEIAKARYNELISTGADTIVVACPICSINFRRVAKEKTKIIDLVDLVYEGIFGGD